MAGHLLVGLGFAFWKTKFENYNFEMYGNIILKNTDVEIPKKLIKVFWGDPGQNGWFSLQFLVH